MPDIFLQLHPAVVITSAVLVILSC